MSLFVHERPTLQRIASTKEGTPFPGSTPKQKIGWSLGIIIHPGSIISAWIIIVSMV